jgi:hypothetical protein
MNFFYRPKKVRERFQKEMDPHTGSIYFILDVGCRGHRKELIPAQNSSLFPSFHFPTRGTVWLKQSDFMHLYYVI